MSITHASTKGTQSPILSRLDPDLGIRVLASVDGWVACTQPSERTSAARAQCVAAGACPDSIGVRRRMQPAFDGTTQHVRQSLDAQVQGADPPRHRGDYKT